MGNANLGARVIIAGSGIAGLFAARQLSSYFDEVILLDRDQIPEDTATRSGVPQGNHFHTLLTGGMEIAEGLFPGLIEMILEGGAVKTVNGRDFVCYLPEGKSYNINKYVPDPFEGPTSYIQSRALLELCIRQKVEAIPNVRTHYETAVKELLWEPGRVVGVLAEHDGEQTAIEADLVVDAAGKASRLLRWLKEQKLEVPEESVVNCDFAYTSAFVKPRDFDAFEGTGFFVFGDPESEHPFRGGALVKVEHGVWLANCGGRDGDYPPRDWSGMMKWWQDHKNPIVADLCGDAEVLGEPAHFRFPSNRRRHYEKLSSFPEGILPIGDVICHFNPLYGQGMSSSARQVQDLGTVLIGRADSGQGLDGIAMEFFPMAYEQTRAPWVFACLADFQSPNCTGDFPTHEQEAIEMLAFLSSISDKDPEAGAMMYRLGAMHAPLSAILTDEWREKKNQT